MNLKDTFSNDDNTRKFFNWLTRIGAGRKFGTCPIVYYQQHQCACYDALKERVGNAELRYSGNMIQSKQNGKWGAVMSAKELFNLADKRY